MQSAAVDLKLKEEKDAQLNRRMEALRKKNEALVKRYQEIQEDKKKAEQEGIAITATRKPGPHEPESERRNTEKNLSVTVDLSQPAVEKCVANERKAASNHGDHNPEQDSNQPHSESHPNRTGSGRLGRGALRWGRGEPRPKKDEPRPERQPPDHEGGDGPERSSRGGCRGGGGGETQGGSDRKSKEWEEKRRQNIEKMNKEMEMIAAYERGQGADGEKNPTRNFLDDPRRGGPITDADRKEGSRDTCNWGGVDFENVKTGADVVKEWTNHRLSGKGSMGDMTVERVPNISAGRRSVSRLMKKDWPVTATPPANGDEWDAQKTDTMFKEDSAVTGEGTPQHSNSREDNKRPPKTSTFGDFLGQSKLKQGARGQGKVEVRATGKQYFSSLLRKETSMHDNRWEVEHEEEKCRKEEYEKENDKEKENEKKDEKIKDASSEKQTDDGGLAEKDEWEDARDGVKEEEDEEVEEAKCEEDDREWQKDVQPTGKTSFSSAPSAPNPKDQRTPRPKVHIPSPQEALSTPEGPKPLSPFSPLEGHQPVSDWGEEMEMLSPKSNLSESPLRPSSTESSPAQLKSHEDEHNTARTLSQTEEPETNKHMSTNQSCSE